MRCHFIPSHQGYQGNLIQPPFTRNHAFLPESNFEECRREVKQKYEEIQSYVVKDDIDSPSSFMNIIRARTDAALSTKSEKRQVLPSRVIWNGNLDHFEEFRKKWKDIMDKLVQVTYLI